MSSDTSPEEDRGAVGTSVIPPATQQKVSDDLSSVKETAQHDLDAIKERAASDVRDLTGQAKEQIGAATDKAKSFANDQKDMAAGQLDGIANAISRVADELSADQNGNATVGRYAQDLASGIQRFAGTVRNKDTDDLVNMAQNFGRSQPLAFLGAAALAGFVASRFAMASAQRTAKTATPPSGSAYGGASDYRSSAVVPPHGVPSGVGTGTSPYSASGTSSYANATSYASTPGTATGGPNSSGNGGTYGNR
jgi:uncharacterized protein YjbJ (UPF0337 family)